MMKTFKSERDFLVAEGAAGIVSAPFSLVAEQHGRLEYNHEHKAATPL